MSLQTAITMIVAAIPFLAVWALLDLRRRVERRRDERIGRQIALTDAIHRELGAVAAPEVWRDRAREWVVSVRLPLHREAMVGAITRIAHELFRRLDREDPPRLRVLLIPPEVRPCERAATIGSRRDPTRLRRAA